MKNKTNTTDTLLIFALMGLSTATTALIFTLAKKSPKCLDASAKIRNEVRSFYASNTNLYKSDSYLYDLIYDYCQARKVNIIQTFAAFPKGIWLKKISAILNSFNQIA